MPDVTPYLWCRGDSDNQWLILILHAQPGAKRTEAVGVQGDALKIKVAASPLEGAANAALVEFLAEIFCVPLRQVKLKHESNRGIKWSKFGERP